MATFKSIEAFPEALLETLDILGFTTMTEIQEKAINPILEGRDILAQSKTGSGKTLAFGLPCVIQTDTNNYKPQTLIITPTRELSDQVAVELRKVAAYKSNLKILTLYGGVPLRTQAESLAKGAHILIGTPGRIQDHLAKGTLILDTVKTLVLDEADRMLDMGFYDEIIKIGSNMPHTKQTLLFSATFPEKIEKLANALLKQPMTIKVDTVQEGDKIAEIVYETSDKLKTLTALIQSYKPESLLIFCNTKAEVVSLTDILHQKGHSVIDIHGDLEQKDRNESVIAFSNGSKRIMVATDVASRGLDIKDIELVINYDLPFDQEVYTHRIGRTGRADAKGTAISLYGPSESEKCAYITSAARTAEMKELRVDATFKILSEYDTLCINGGKKTKLRAGDILGTLCKEIGIDPKMIGKINITDTKSYVALHHTVTDKVLKALKKTPIKKKRYITWILN
ncbi:ATP-dependent RNA helicase DbpA [Sulfurovum sp. XTW-4]|uniref:ATP-dependent RNA helicase DbpA n=1 Tax=Sulfurovum xiamenensis TaxID=3019066 RepID=A0ABT7QPZ0_9BACT|nr:ATP-dependent RNA helicase DbpA [Sulfurovum xiamenensis]MDM5263096.1 ATP-dependent RNA helicase DbpA [Sulfurovum xiamenensis]